MIKVFEPFQPKVKLHIRTEFLQGLWDRYVPVSSGLYEQISLIHLKRESGTEAAGDQIQLLLNLIWKNLMVQTSLQKNPVFFHHTSVDYSIAHTTKYYMEQLKRVDFRTYRSLKQYITILEKTEAENRRYENWQRDSLLIRGMQSSYRILQNFSAQLNELYTVRMAQTEKFLETRLFQSMNKREYKLLTEALIWMEKTPVENYIRNCSPEIYREILHRLEKEKEWFVFQKQRDKIETEQYAFPKQRDKIEAEQYAFPKQRDKIETEQYAFPKQPDRIGMDMSREELLLCLQSLDQREFRRFYQNILFPGKGMPQEEIRQLQTGVVWKRTKGEVNRQIAGWKAEETHSFWEKLPLVMKETCRIQERLLREGRQPENRTYPNPQQESRVYANPQQESRVYPNPQQESRVYPNLQQESRTYANPQQESKLHTDLPQEKHLLLEKESVLWQKEQYARYRVCEKFENKLEKAQKTYLTELHLHLKKILPADQELQMLSEEQDRKNNAAELVHQIAKITERERTGSQVLLKEIRQLEKETVRQVKTLEQNLVNLTEQALEAYQDVIPAADLRNAWQRQKDTVDSVQQWDVRQTADFIQSLDAPHLVDSIQPLDALQSVDFIQPLDDTLQPVDFIQPLDAQHLTDSMQLLDFTQATNPIQQLHSVQVLDSPQVTDSAQPFYSTQGQEDLSEPLRRWGEAILTLVMPERRDGIRVFPREQSAEHSILPDGNDWPTARKRSHAESSDGNMLSDNDNQPFMQNASNMESPVQNILSEETEIQHQIRKAKERAELQRLFIHLSEYGKKEISVSWTDQEEKLQDPVLQELIQYIRRADAAEYQEFVRQLANTISVTTNGEKQIQDPELQLVYRETQLKDASIRELPEKPEQSGRAARRSSIRMEETKTPFPDPGNLQFIYEYYPRLVHQVQRYEIRRQEEHRTEVQHLKTEMRRLGVELPDLGQRLDVEIRQADHFVRQRLSKRQEAQRADYALLQSDGNVWEIQTADSRNQQGALQYRKLQTGYAPQPLEEQKLQYMFAGKRSQEEQQKNTADHQKETMQMKALQKQLDVRLKEVEQKLQNAGQGAEVEVNVRELAEKVKRQLHEELHMERLRRGMV